MRLFALYRERLGRGLLEMELPSGATVAALMAELGSAYPPLRSLVTNTMVAVNQEYAEPGLPLHDGDEVALIPPVSGGAP